MKNIACTALAAALLFGGFAQSPALAQGLTCDDIEFNSNVTDQFPDVARACQEVVERDGKLYAKVVADVVRVAGRTVTLDIKTRDGSSIRQSFRPAAEFRVLLGGTRTRVRDLVRGQEIRMYLPNDRWEVAQIEEIDVPVITTPLVAPEPEPDEDVAAALPSTASPLPLVGLGAMVFLVLGAGLTSTRRRFQK